MRVLEAKEPTVDLLVSDINMPGLGGIELVSMARDGAHRLPILMMSGTNRWAFKPDTIAADITVLEKPFTLHQLLEASRSRWQRIADDSPRRFKADG